MSSKRTDLGSTRRAFLQQTSLLALAPLVHAIPARESRAAARRARGRVLVVIDLEGGNDGINTVVPFRDEGYAKCRSVLRIARDSLLKIDDQVGLHPAMRPAMELLESGRLAIVQGVGYPRPNRSHDESRGIWHTCRIDHEEHAGLGWIGRALDASIAAADEPASTVFVGKTAVPAALRARRTGVTTIDDLADYELGKGILPAPSHSAKGDDDLTTFLRRAQTDAQATIARVERARSSGDASGYPDHPLAQRLKLVARLMKAELQAPVFYVLQPGYDTHANQLPFQADLLGELASSLHAFLADLRAARLSDGVLVMTVSDFGRRVEENASGGTDHGSAAPLFLTGDPVRAGLHGATPSLVDLEEGDLKHSVDFRSVYATVLADWLRLPFRDALGGDFTKLELLKS